MNELITGESVLSRCTTTFRGVRFLQGDVGLSVHIGDDKEYIPCQQAGKEILHRR